MAKKLNRILAFVLVVCMCVSALPLQALAAEETTTETTTETSPEGLVTDVTTTTTTTTDENGNTTVTITIDKSTEGTTEDGVTVDREESKSTTTTTNADGDKIGESWVEEGTETKEWTEEDTGDEAGQPEVVAPVIPGETTTGTAGVTSETVTNPDGSVTTTTTTDRTITTTTSELEATVNESNSGLVGDQEITLEGLTPVYDVIDGQKEDKGGVFDYQFNSGLNSKYANPENWVGTNSMPEDADLRFLGTGEHTTYYASIAYVVYEKDEEGNTVYDEDGNAVIKELWRYDPNVYTSSSNKQLTIDGQLVTELPEGVDGLPEYDQTPGGNRPTIHVLMDEYGNTVYGYCIDNMQSTKSGAWYKISNLEDCDYYASEDAENHVRNIVLNGYWGTSDIPDENDNYSTGSLESIKEKLKTAIANGDLEDEVELPEYDEEGNPKVDENGNPVLKSWSMTELLNDLTSGEAFIATQAAIWSYSNGSIAAQNGKDGYLIIDPDFSANHKAGSSKGNEDILDDFGGARIDFLYNWLMNLETEEESTIVINEKNFVEDMSITVGDKVSGHEANQDENKDNDVYNADLNFTLAFVPGENDDLLVQIKYTDLDGNEVTVVKRLAGENSEGQTYEDIKPEADGSYVLRGLKLSENEDFNFDLRLEGTQYLENGVYVYEAVEGRTASQNFVGVAEGERNVDVSVGVTIRFDVDEDNHVVAERTWYNEGDPVYEPVEEPEPPQIFRLTNQTGGEEIIDEEVPLASAPKTGDMTSLIVIITMMAAMCLVIMTISDKKRRA